MAKHKKNSWGFGPRIVIDTEMVKSEAFQNLDRSANLLLLLFMAKRHAVYIKDRKTGRDKRVFDNLDRITMTYKKLEAPPFRWNRPKITRAIDKLLAHGFIEIKRQGGRYRKDKTVYALIEKWRTWRASDPPVNTRPKDARRGYQGKHLGATKNKAHTSVTHTHAHERYP